MHTTAPHMAQGTAHSSTQRRFREMHFHRFVLGTRSNMHGACLLRSRLPVRLPRPHTMQQRYDHPPPGVGYRRVGGRPADPDSEADADSASEPAAERGADAAQREQQRLAAAAAIRDECARTARCIAQGKDSARTHVVVATQTGLLFFVAGFGYWNVLDVDLRLRGEACVGVKAFEAEPPGAPLPVLVVALTTYVKGAGDGCGRYRLYALGAESLAPVPQDFLALHGLDSMGTTADVPAAASAAAGRLAANDYAFVEERAFALRVDGATVRADLAYLPFRISQDIVAGQPPVLAVAGNDNVVHRYAVGSNGVFELAPLLCPRADGARTFTAFDGRVVGRRHVQVTAHQEFAVALQVSEPAGRGAARRLVVADEEVYDAAPVLATVFSPDAPDAGRTAYDAAVAERVSSASPRRAAMAAGDEYDTAWPLGGTADDVQPRVHVLVGFVGEDAVVYHDVAEAGLDPVATLVGGVAARGAGRGGVFALAGSAREGLISAVHFDDLDFDGQREVIVGTVAGSVLVYKHVPARGYVLVWRRRFPAPVYGLFSVDINSDGVNELVVVTLRGGGWRRR
ncbi:hypothetical protein GGI15_002618 [Coemansia interrupta]|uniref:Uncharacterized protein n=1 Tax=Coemansia interrupta TaxID=1126814 RepID=A0A9W8LKX3_9FUNG|nr:hypothetical protein GGI15_002618 [Coemansia interrupta]